MHHFAATADRLRRVKEAQRSFLTLWALHQTGERVREGEAMVEEIDTADIEAAILQLDVYGSDSLANAMLSDE